MDGVWDLGLRPSTGTYKVIQRCNEYSGSDRTMGWQMRMK